MLNIGRVTNHEKFVLDVLVPFEVGNLLLDVIVEDTECDGEHL